MMLQFARIYSIFIFVWASVNWNQMTLYIVYYVTWLWRHQCVPWQNAFVPNNHRQCCSWWHLNAKMYTNKYIFSTWTWAAQFVNATTSDRSDPISGQGSSSRLNVILPSFMFPKPSQQVWPQPSGLQNMWNTKLQVKETPFLWTSHNDGKETLKQALKRILWN